MAATIDTDLKYLLDREGVESDIMDKLSAAGITSVRLFAAVATDPGIVKQIAKDDLGINTDTLAGKVSAGKLVVGWELAKARSAYFAKLEAETEVRSDTKPIRQSDFKTMRESYEGKWWKLEPKQVPSKAYTEKVSDHLEKGEPRAELLSEVTNHEEG